MLLPSSNRVAEPEIPAMLPEGVSIHTTRLKLAGTSREQLLAMTEKVEEAAALLADADVDLIAFHCTGVWTFDPAMETRLKQRITSVAKKPATATSEALIAAFRALAVRRIVLISPYPREINRREIAFFAHHNITVLHDVGLELKSGADFAKIAPEEWHRLTLDNQHDDADAYFLSCTTIRSTPVISALESDLAKPVVTSNQALAWHALRMAGVSDPMPGFGDLFVHH